MVVVEPMDVDDGAAVPSLDELQNTGVLENAVDSDEEEVFESGEEDESDEDEEEEDEFEADSDFDDDVPKKNSSKKEKKPPTPSPPKKSLRNKRSTKKQRQVEEEEEETKEVAPSQEECEAGHTQLVTGSDVEMISPQSPYYESQDSTQRDKPHPVCPNKPSKEFDPSTLGLDEDELQTPQQQLTRNRRGRKKKQQLDPPTPVLDVVDVDENGDNDDKEEKEETKEEEEEEKPAPKSRRGRKRKSDEPKVEAKDDEEEEKEGEGETPPQQPEKKKAKKNVAPPRKVSSAISEPPAVARLDRTSLMVYNYLKRNNRPYGLADLARAFPDYTKLQVNKALTKLNENSLAQTNDKKLFWVDQSVFGDNIDSLSNKMRDELENIQDTIDEPRGQLESLQQEVRRLEEEPADSELLERIESAKKKLEECNVAFKMLSASETENQVNMSKNAAFKEHGKKSAERLKEEFLFFKRIWRERKQIVMETIDDMMEVMPKSTKKKKLIEDMGIETDEVMNINIKDLVMN